jgi:hypothetical protein
MPRTKVAFIATPVVASAVYWWFGTVEHLQRVGVVPSERWGFFGLILIFAFVGTMVLAMPAYLLLRHWHLTGNLPILFMGTLIGWLFISFADDGRPWLHPEAFATGMIAASAFLLIRNEGMTGRGAK